MWPSAIAGILVVVATGPLGAQTPPSARHRSPAEYERLAREIFEELIEIDTTQAGSTTAAAEAVAGRLRAAGFPDSDIRVLGPVPNKANLVARLRGRDTGKKPVLLLAHLDVVDARREDWTVDPFTFLERDGWFYGRGTMDDKDEAAIGAVTLIRLKREGYIPDRDVLLALTADEDGGSHNGVEWLLANHRDLIDAGLAINEGGGGALKGEKRLSNNVQLSEKVYQSFELVVANRGGHSSLPRADNAINQLAAALTRVAAYTFPVKLNEVTRAYFEGTAKIETADIAAAIRRVLSEQSDAAANAVLAAIPEYNARLRTTCIATKLEAGQAENALPQRSRAVVNCRLLPGESPDDVLATLRRVVADPEVKIAPLAPARPSAPTALAPEVMQPIAQVTDEMWPGVPVIPTMGSGGTDGARLRRAGIPVYGVAGVFGDVDDDRMHGRDERIHSTWFFEGLEFAYRLVKRLTGGAPTQ